MSLDVCLIRKKWVSYDACKTHTEEDEEVYQASVTHNLSDMAKASGIYQALWEPDLIGSSHAKDIIDIVEKGLADLKARPKYFKKFNSPNGWGVYKDFVPWVEKYLEALKKYPESIIYISR